MWWYNIIWDKNGFISHLLQIDPITTGSILLNFNLVELKRENIDPILTVKIIVWGKFIYYFGISIEAHPSRLEKIMHILSILGI